VFIVMGAECCRSGKSSSVHSADLCMVVLGLGLGLVGLELG